jgi:cyclic pyranopterin phosphate synthase
VARQSGRTPQFVQVAFNSLDQSAQRGDFDLALSGIEVEVAPRAGGVEVKATVRTVDRTGVEMEALAAVAAACLTVYDMLKRYERGMRIESIELIEKAGGRTGRWVRPRSAARPARARAPRARSSRTRGG